MGAYLENDYGNGGHSNRQIDNMDNIDLDTSIKFTRKSILDCIELAYGQTPQWPLIRAKIMAAFGKNGLERFINTNNWLERKERNYEARINAK